MILLFPIALALTIAILWRSRDQGGSQGAGCRWFWAWSLVGAALSFSFLTGLSIGLFVLPVALLLLWIVLSRSPRWPESVGFIEGIGIILLAVAFVNRADRPCSPNGSLQIGSTSAGQSVSCGGLDPHPWLYVGVLLVALAAAAYAVARRNA